jgi:hypothetical protein
MTSTPGQSPNPHPHLEGLSGWLILVGFGLIISPLLVLSSIVRVNLPALAAMQDRLTPSPHPILDLLVFSELIMNSIFIIATLALIYLFFRKDRRFPIWMVVYYAAHAVLLALNHLAFALALPNANLNAGRATVVRAFVGACIWIPYLLVSRRVKVTFVR